MPNLDFTVQPAMSDRSTTLFRSVLAAILGAACALAVMQRASAPVHPGSSSLLSATASYGGSPFPVDLAIGDYPAAPLTFLGAEPGQYMLVVVFSLVGIISWKVNQARLGIDRRGIDRWIADTHQGRGISKDAVVNAGWSEPVDGNQGPSPAGPEHRRERIVGDPLPTIERLTSIA